MLNSLNNYIFLTFLTTLAFSDNLILFFISWVGLNISLYGILLKSFNSYNIEITLKYFVSGSVITIFMLFAMLLFFIDYFTFSFDSASYLYFNTSSVIENKINLYYVSKFQKIYYILIVFALLFKLGSFPFHFYIPEIYEALDIKKTMLMYTVTLKISIFFTLLKLLSNLWFLNIVIQDILLCSGLGSVFVSSFAILKQYKLKKFFAYSYLNSIGYVMVCLSLAINSNFGEISFFTAKVYFFTYMLCWVGILDIIKSHSFKNRFGLEEVFYVSDLLYISNGHQKITSSYSNNNTNACLLVLISSLMGLPPMAGFFSKSILFFELSSGGCMGFSFLIILLLTPVVAFGYLKILINIVFNLKKSKIIKSLTNWDSTNIVKNKNIIFYDDCFWELINYKKITTAVIIFPVIFYFFEKTYFFSIINTI